VPLLSSLLLLLLLLSGERDADIHHQSKAEQIEREVSKTGGSDMEG